MNHNPEEIVYSINVNDLQTVASRVLDRRMSDGEVELVADALGDFIDWYHAIANAIDNRLTT